MNEATEPPDGCVESASPSRDEQESPMFGKLLKSALIAPVVAVLLMIAAPVPAPAAEEDRYGEFNSRQGQWTGPQDRWHDGRDGRRQRRAEWRDDRRDDRHDRWVDRRGDRQDRRADQRERRQEWWQNRWRRHWDRWDSRAAQRRHRHPHGHRWHPHRY
ncbi:MAG: hypothetical protein ACU0B1_03505 [Thermohalobaculum sp.]